MSPSPKPEREGSHEDSREDESTPDPQGISRSASHKGPRKRTKTGCLTCRKRRIKCGEQKPICANCTKSKRFCEGYNPRTHFKPSPTGNLEDMLAARSVMFNQTPFEGFTLSGLSNSSLRAIAPTPPPLHHRSLYENSNLAAGQMAAGLSHDISMGASGIPLSADALRSFPTLSPGFPPEMASSQPLRPARHASISGPHPDHHWSRDFNSDQARQRSTFGRSQALTHLDMLSTMAGTQDTIDAYSAMPSTGDSVNFQYRGQSDFDTPSDPTRIAACGDQSLPTDHPFYPGLMAQVSDPRLDVAAQEVDPRRYGSQGFVQRPSFNLSLPLDGDSPPPLSPTGLDYEDGEDEDDPWDVDIDIGKDNIRPSSQARKDLNTMLMDHVPRNQLQGSRNFTTYLNENNVLAGYRPSHSALPQADEKAARIFCHFVSSTGPSLSIFERSPTAGDGNSDGATISSFQQPLWTYHLPNLALQHPPLMHAMLALSALHISKLQQTSPGPSIKHFTYALRRVGRLIGLPNRRNEITTLAANLLLGFYEIMSAETSKWNIHLSGAKVLVMEIDFAGKTRNIRAMRAAAKTKFEQLSADEQELYVKSGDFPEALFPDKDWDVDEEFIGALTGTQVDYDNQFQIGVNPDPYQTIAMTAKDVELYKMQADLYWWFCKQDIFQSMISGNRLLMPLDHWIFCPPRGKVGQLDTIYATMDHLCLIMARLADFGAKDSVRKRRAMAAKQSPGAPPNGRPSNGMNGPPPGQGPPLGYMPAPDQSQPLHSAFATMAANLQDPGFARFQPSNPNPEPESIEAATASAFAEHAAISSALELFASRLPTSFNVLPADAAASISTPFGPALQYRTHTISCIWALYYSALILLARLHPSMPPAAMISAQVAARQTASWSQTIGRICAGLYYPQRHSLKTGNLNPSLGAALIESTFSLFFAGVQYTDPVQRGWTINKLREISRLSGWQTAAAVAAGCEFAWQAMGKAGRGPAYRPTMNWRSSDERVGDKEMKARDRMKREDSHRATEAGATKAQDVSGDGGRLDPGTEHEANAARRQEELEGRYFIAAGKNGPTSPISPTTMNTAIHPFSSQPRRPSELSPSSSLPGGIGDMDISNDPADLSHLSKRERIGSADLSAAAHKVSITHDRDSIGTNPYARTHWALGLLSVEEDIAKIDLGKGEA